MQQRTSSFAACFGSPGALGPWSYLLIVWSSCAHLDWRLSRPESMGYDDGYGGEYDEPIYEAYDNSYTTQTQSLPEYYDYGHGTSEDAYDSYAQEEWAISRPSLKAPPSRQLITRDLHINGNKTRTQTQWTANQQLRSAQNLVELKLCCTAVNYEDYYFNTKDHYCFQCMGFGMVCVLNKELIFNALQGTKQGTEHFIICTLRNP
ncbi:Hypothetical predicted protein [Podarcis lilfordi]|uniref:Sam68 tyrosine-rich domain-containing protein n=1 Tax=Podarcis lilfordi TaxID=74358 RepID=A0AA35K169_9SAUR|nr:Hypothetical predicted protein [Podarcis lilfordi]